MGGKASHFSDGSKEGTVRPYSGTLWPYTGQCTPGITKEIDPAMLREPYEMLRIKHGSAACKSNALPIVLSLTPETLYIL